jgi:hypothetical protein
MTTTVWITDNNAIELLGLNETPTDWFKLVSKAGEDDQQVVSTVNLFLRKRGADFRVQARRPTQYQEYTGYPGLERVTKFYLQQVSEYHPKVGTIGHNVHDWQVKIDTHHRH